MLFISLAIPVSQEFLTNVEITVMFSIHDMFPPKENGEDDQISMKKLTKGEIQYTTKSASSVLNLTVKKKQLLEEEKCALLLMVLQSGRGIVFNKFKSQQSGVTHFLQSGKAVGC